MASNDFTDGGDKADFRLLSSMGDILLEIKRTSNANDLRGALLSLAYTLMEEPQSTRAICALVDTRLSIDRVRSELSRFHEVSGERYRERMFLVMVVAGRVVLGDLPASELALDKRILAATRESESAPGRVTQQLVKTAAIQAWQTGANRLRVGELVRATGASKPTVAAAIRAMLQAGLVHRVGDHFQLPSEFPWESWRRLADDHAAERKVVRFTDPTGHAPSPLRMLRRLVELQQAGETRTIELGGVDGTKQYYPDLDITASPRLDLCVYDGNLDFVRKLDAGLKATDDPDAKAVLVVHMNRPLRGRDMASGTLQSASVLDCLADLLEIGLQSEARDFVHALQRKRMDALSEEFDA